MLDVNEFDSMKIGIASPEKILEWSHGEVTKPETINYRTLKAEKDGLFCEKIFGPTKDWECKCGKYKKMRYRGTVCDKCGVEVTSSKVRRERMGHIKLACPVSHIWYFKGTPSRIGLILDISPRQLERVLYFAAYIVLDPGETKLVKQQVMNEQEYQQAVQEYGEGSFKAGMGAEAIKTLLEELDLHKMEAALKEDIATGSGQRKVRSIRRLEEVEAFIQSKNRPEWMVLTVLPVIPPELRPMVQLDGGRFATSDLNDLYRRVINRNNRLKRLLELGAPEIIVRNEKRMLQEAVDAVIDNGRRGRAVSGPGNRPLKSLSDMLKGKQGRFRQNLLGKRVDYSGRSVIVVGPELKMYQCGLPKEMAIELFKPFIMHELISRGMASNLKVARKKVDKLAPEVWDVLADVIKEHPVLLNRAPTLHRLGIQAFEPVLWEGRAIKLHPLVCPGYNADFDGDQMACHLPLSVEAQAEARTLMLSINNILSTKDGKPVAIPSQEMILGAYYLTIVEQSKEEEDTMDVSQLHCYTGYDEVMLAYTLKKLKIHDFIKVDIPGHGLVVTTPGRLIFNFVLQEPMRFYYKRPGGQEALGITIGKKQMGKLVNDTFKKLGFTETAKLLDNVKALGFHFALVSGISIGINDVAVPPEKDKILAEADKQVARVKAYFRRGFITDNERYRKVVEIWSKATDDVGAAMKGSMRKFNPLTMMAQSGARGNDNQIRQLAGMRGLIADTSGKTVEMPVKANFREGLTVLDYFTSSHGARKGLADTALRTADSGYLTRRLVDVSQDVIIREDDCDVQVLDFEREKAIIASEEDTRKAIMNLKPELLGTILDQDVVDVRSGDILIVKGKVLDSSDITTLNRHLVPSITVTPKAEDDNLETREPVSYDLGQQAGYEEYKKAITHRMHTHFIGKKFEKDVLTLDGDVLFPAGTVITDEIADRVINSNVPVIYVRMDEAEGVELSKIVESGGLIESLADRISGRCPVEDIVNPETGKVIAVKNEEISDDQAEEIEKYYDTVKVRSILTCHSAHGVCAKCYGRNLATGRDVEIGEAVGIIAAQSIGEPGTQLTMRTFHSGGVAGGDITQGLPRVEELFEARRPKGLAIIAEFGGVVTIKDTKKKREIIVTDQETGNSKTYLIPYGSRIKVADGQVLEAGDVLTEGSINPHDLLKVKGVRAVQDYMIREVQRVYRLQGVEINDKHIEMIVRQMLKKIRIEESGDSDVLPGVSMDVLDFNEMNEELIAAGKQPAEGKQVMLGITKASLATDSFLSAASFQETTKVLTEAAINGKVDHLIGLKENVIIGKLIPAGTGMKRYRNIKLSTGEIEDKIQEQEAPVAEEPQEETDAPLEEADKIILNEDDTQDVDE